MPAPPIMKIKLRFWLTAHWQQNCSLADVTRWAPISNVAVKMSVQPALPNEWLWKQQWKVKCFFDIADYNSESKVNFFKEESQILWGLRIAAVIFPKFLESLPKFYLRYFLHRSCREREKSGFVSGNWGGRIFRKLIYTIMPLCYVSGIFFVGQYLLPLAFSTSSSVADARFFPLLQNSTFFSIHYHQIFSKHAHTIGLQSPWPVHLKSFPNTANL